MCRREVAVGDDADQRAVVIDDADTAQARPDAMVSSTSRMLASSARQRHFIAAVHQVGDADQGAAQAAAGMKIAILVGRKALALHQRHRQRIAQAQHHGGGGGGRQPHRAGFRRARQQQLHIGRLHQGGVRIAGDADQGNAEALGIGDEIGQFRRLAAPGQHQQHILAGDGAQIAMAGFGGMDEIGRRAGGGQGGGDLAGDMAGLAHAADDDPALAPPAWCLRRG